MAMQQQLGFIAYIQRMLVEGDFSDTYKFALLHALADISIEKQQLKKKSRQLHCLIMTVLTSLVIIISTIVLRQWQPAE